MPDALVNVAQIIWVTPTQVSIDFTGNRGKITISVQYNQKVSTVQKSFVSLRENMTRANSNSIFRTPTTKKLGILQKPMPHCV